jgi:hypothetical protein
MGLEGLAAAAGLAVALAVPAWLVVEEVLHRWKAFHRAETASGAAISAPAPGVGAAVRLSSKAA